MCRAARRCALCLSKRRLCRLYPPRPRPSVPAAAGRRKGAARPCGMGLRVPLPDVVAMQTRQPNLEGAGEIPLRRLVKEALRMRLSRIIVGEVWQEECLNLFISLNSGCRNLPTAHGLGQFFALLAGARAQFSQLRGVLNPASEPTPIPCDNQYGDAHLPGYFGGLHDLVSASLTGARSGPSPHIALIAAVSLAVGPGSLIYRLKPHVARLRARVGGFLELDIELRGPPASGATELESSTGAPTPEIGTGPSFRAVRRRAVRIDCSCVPQLNGPAAASSGSPACRARCPGEGGPWIMSHMLALTSARGPVAPARAGVPRSRRVSGDEHPDHRCGHHPAAGPAEEPDPGLFAPSPRRTRLNTELTRPSGSASSTASAT